MKSILGHVLMWFPAWGPVLAIFCFVWKENGIDSAFQYLRFMVAVYLFIAGGIFIAMYGARLVAGGK